MDLPELLEIAEQERQSQKAVQIRCCVAAGCLSSNALSVKTGLEQVVTDAGLADIVQVSGVGCMRLCCQGPLVQVDRPTEPDNPGILYEKVTADQVPTIAAALQSQSSLNPQTPLQQGDLTQPFFTNQRAIVLENSGKIDPERIEAYIAAAGYQALHHALHEMNPLEVINTITHSGLRGRGGGGYPTGLKWATVEKAVAERKFVICNADEGDPGAFMDRSVLESDPHRVLEGMAIAAYAIGATQGYIYVRAEYPLAISRLQIAIRQAQRLRLLGSQVFDSPFDFRIDIRIGAGAYVCGEETALMASIEGKRGVPSPRPPYPAERGLWKPLPILPPLFATEPIGLPVLVLKKAKARKFSLWQAKFATRD